MCAAVYVYGVCMRMYMHVCMYIVCMYIVYVLCVHVCVHQYVYFDVYVRVCASKCHT